MAQQQPQWTEQQRQAYYQRYYAQYRQPARPPKNDSHLFQILMLVGVIIIAVALLLYFIGPSEEVAPVVEEPVVEVPIIDEPVIQEPEEEVYEATVPLEIVSNEFVNSLDDPMPVSDEFVLDEEIIIYTVVEGFDQLIEDGNYKPDLVYGMQVIDPDGNAIESLTRPELAVSEKDFDNPEEAYYFTSKISTFQMKEGIYKVNIRVVDKISGEEAIYFKHFELVKPDSIFISDVYLGASMNDSLFSKSSNTFSSGDNISLIAQISGFQQEGKALNVDVDLKVYKDEELQLPLSNYLFFDSQEAETEEEHSISLDGYIDTTGWLPGDYMLELVAIDHKTGERDTSSVNLRLR